MEIPRRRPGNGLVSWEFCLRHCVALQEKQPRLTLQSWTTLCEAAKRRQDELYHLAREPLHRGERPRMVPSQVLQYVH